MAIIRIQFMLSCLIYFAKFDAISLVQSYSKIWQGRINAVKTAFNLSFFLKMQVWVGSNFLFNFLWVSVRERKPFWCFLCGVDVSLKSWTFQLECVSNFTSLRVSHNYILVFGFFFFCSKVIATIFSKDIWCSQKVFIT